MAENTFRPQTRQFDERQITRVQRDFTAGMFKDVPASVIPENGVSDLVDFKNMGNRLVGRSGSKRWSNTTLPTIATSITVSSSTVSGIYRTSVTSGYTFTSSNVGDWIIFADGTNERITSVTNSTTIVSRTFSSDDKSASGASLRGQVNAIYFHKYLEKIILHIGSKIYIAENLDIDSWQEAYCISYDTPANSLSVFDEYNNYVFLYNSNGIYKILLSTHGTSSVLYYKINSSEPTDLLSNNTEDTYGWRYTYCMSRLSSTGDDRNRQTDGVYLETESAATKIDSNGKDYGTMYDSSDLSSTNSVTVSGFTVPDATTDIPEYHWTHYSVYRTLDVGNNGINPVSGAGNNEELFIWLEDFPVAKAFKTSTDGSGHCTLHQGYQNNYDLNSTFRVYDGSSTQDKTIIGVSVSLDRYTISGSFSGTITNRAGCVGATHCGLMSQSGTTVTLSEGTDFASGDVRKTLFVSDGTYRHITSYTSPTVVEVAETDTVSSGTAVCWNPTTRKYRDARNDDDLKPRIANYPLYQRFWDNLPSVNTGKIAAGFMFTGSINGNRMYYSQIPEGFEYLVGYYHPYYQSQFYKDQIKAIKGLPDALVVYCGHSIRTHSLNVFDSVSLPEVGSDITVITKETVVDDKIGMLDIGSIQEIDNGKQIFITNEPAIRIFDGTQLSENLAYDRIMEDLRAMQTATSSMYTPTDGYIFWGSNQEA